MGLTCANVAMFRSRPQVKSASPHAGNLRTQLRGTFPRNPRDTPALAPAHDSVRAGQARTLTWTRLKREDLCGELRGFEPRTPSMRTRLLPSASVVRCGWTAAQTHVSNA